MRHLIQSRQVRSCYVPSYLSIYGHEFMVAIVAIENPILVIVVVLFGVGRIGKVGSELGTAMREFRKGLSGEEQATDETDKNK